MLKGTMAHTILNYVWCKVLHFKVQSNTVIKNMLRQLFVTAINIQAALVIRGFDQKTGEDRK